MEQARVLHGYSVSIFASKKCPRPSQSCSPFSLRVPSHIVLWRVSQRGAEYLADFGALHVTTATLRRQAGTSGVHPHEIGPPKIRHAHLSYESHFTGHYLPARVDDRPRQRTARPPVGTDPCTASPSRSTGLLQAPSPARQRLAGPSQLSSEYGQKGAKKHTSMPCSWRHQCKY